MELSFLAGFAEEGGTGGVDAAADRVPALGAGLALLAVNGQLDGEVAGIAVGVEKIAQSGASRFNAFTQYISYLNQQFLPLRLAEFAG